MCLPHRGVVFWSIAVCMQTARNAICSQLMHQEESGVGSRADNKSRSPRLARGKKQSQGNIASVPPFPIQKSTSYAHVLKCPETMKKPPSSTLSSG